ERAAAVTIGTRHRSGHARRPERWHEVGTGNPSASLEELLDDGLTIDRELDRGPYADVAEALAAGREVEHLDRLGLLVVGGAAGAIRVVGDRVERRREVG